MTVSLAIWGTSEPNFLSCKVALIIYTLKTVKGLEEDVKLIISYRPVWIVGGIATVLGKVADRTARVHVCAWSMCLLLGGDGSVQAKGWLLGL